jgi:hypothetical protein
MNHLRRDDRDLLIPAFGVHERRSVPADEIISNLRSAGWPTYVISGGPGSKAEFFEAVRASLPTDPPMGPRPNWDGLLDSVSNGLLDLNAERVAIVWPDSLMLARSDPAEYKTARDMLTVIVMTLIDPKFSNEGTKALLVLLA